MEFKDVFNRIIFEKKLTDKDLADYLKVDIEEIEDYRIGIKEPSVGNIIKLANYFDVTTDYLIGAIGVNLKYKDKEDLLNKIKSKLDIFNEPNLVKFYKVILEMEKRIED